MPNLYSLL